MAARRDVSLAELAREGVEHILAASEHEQKWRYASALVGRYSGEASDVAVNLDRYLDDAYRS